MSTEKFVPSRERHHLYNRAIIDAFVERTGTHLQTIALGIGIHPSKFSEMLNGERVIRGDQLHKLALFIGCECWQLTNPPGVVCVSSDDHDLLVAMTTATSLMANKLRKERQLRDGTTDD